MVADAMKPDLLDGLSGRQRLQREREDALFLRTAIKHLIGSAPSLERERNRWVGTDVFRREDFRSLAVAEQPDVRSIRSAQTRL